MAHEAHADSAGKLTFHIARSGIGSECLTVGRRVGNEDAAQAPQAMAVPIDTLM